MIDYYSHHSNPSRQHLCVDFPLFSQKSYSTLCPASVSIAASCRRVFSMHQFLPLLATCFPLGLSLYLTRDTSPSFASFFSFLKSTGVLFVVISYSGGVH